MSVNIFIENTTVNANGFFAGINANNVNIIGSTLNATGVLYGIAASEGSISDSNVTAKGTGEESRGIAVREGLSINNSDVTADGGEKAIITEGDITLTNASIVEGSYDGKHVKIEKTGSSGAVAPILNPVTQSNDSSSSGSDRASLCASIERMIRDAAQGATVRVTITKGTSLCKMAVDALEARKDVTLVVDYAVNDGMYEATIPAGTDLAQYKNAVGGIDFETLTVHFGGKQIF